ncbi:MAG: S41 family peptidase, partial [Verrucomicrobiota bacterium]
MSMRFFSVSSRRRHTILWLLAVFAAVNAWMGFTVYSRASEGADEEEALERVRVMMQVLQLIRQNYVDTEATAPTRLINHALEGMVGALDPFSAYLEPEEYNDMMESTEGEFGGLGVVVTIREGHLTVISPMEDSPGAEAGLRAGDRIVEIDGSSTQDMGLGEAVHLLKGAPGTEVTITIERPKTGDSREVTITRELIEVPSVKDVQLIEDDIAYLRITQFNEPTADDLRRELEGLLEKDIGGLVVDVRNNPGGLLQTAVDVSSLFLPKGKLVVSTEGRVPSQKQRYVASNGSQLPNDLPVAILINGGSASAAEILAGSLKDWGRAVLVGEKTFGKGSVQNIIQLPDNSALRLTTAKYYTPSRTLIHEQGIEPNIAVSMSEAEQEQLLRRRRSGESEVLMDSQLERAVETLKSYRTFRRAGRGQLTLAESERDQ